MCVCVCVRVRVRVRVRACACACACAGVCTGEMRVPVQEDKILTALDAAVTEVERVRYVPPTATRQRRKLQHAIL